jgi:hypothetical protein
MSSEDLAKILLDADIFILFDNGNVHLQVIKVVCSKIHKMGIDLKRRKQNKRADNHLRAKPAWGFGKKEG